MTRSKKQAHVRETQPVYRGTVPLPVRSHRGRLESARRVFSSDAQVADALGVDRAQVTRWREGRTAPDPENADRIVGLDAAVELLMGHLEPSSIAKWLKGVNAHLNDRRPVELLREGNLSEVIGAIEALKSGAYA